MIRVFGGREGPYILRGCRSFEWLLVSFPGTFCWVCVGSSSDICLSFVFWVSNP